VNEESGSVKFVLSQSSIQKIESRGSQMPSYMPPSIEEIKYQAPEVIEHHYRTINALSWSIGIIM
jgi:hypothetical protein